MATKRPSLRGGHLNERANCNIGTAPAEKRSRPFEKVRG